MILNINAETMTRSEKVKLQNQKLQKLVERVYEKTSFYQKGFHALGLAPTDIEGIHDIHKLPFTTAIDLSKNSDLQLMTAAAKVEGRYYMQLSRLEESVKFAQEMNCTSIGVAFCIGLAAEANYIVQYFQKFFTVHSVCCKVCGFDKHQLNLEQIKEDRYEAMCNPAIQAKLLNEAKTELNFAIGLCIGHDMIFNRHSKAPVSTLVAKDRLLAHNNLRWILAQ